MFLIGAYNNKQKSSVIVHDQRFPEKIDTLKYNYETRGCLFITIPKSKGHYTYEAIMTIPTLRDTIKFPIKWGFEVE